MHSVCTTSQSEVPSSVGSPHDPQAPGGLQSSVHFTQAIPPELPGISNQTQSQPPHEYGEGVVGAAVVDVVGAGVVVLCPQSGAGL